MQLILCVKSSLTSATVTVLILFILFCVCVQVKHMVNVETDEAHYNRKAAEAAALAPREPIRIRH